MTDKVKHFIAGALAASAVAVPVYADTFSLFAGICKEIGDCSGELNGFDPKDMAFTILGAIVPVLFILGLHFGRG